MAAETLKKKTRASRAKPAVEEEVAAVESPKPAKRRATEDASPVAAKKVKSSGKSTEKKPAAAKSEKAGKAAPKKSAKKSKEEEVSAPEHEADAEEDDENDDDEGDGTLALARTLGHSDDDEQDEGASTFKAGQDVGKIPDVKTGKRKSLKSAGDENGPRVIYIGHIPFGFFEQEIRKYLTQFGPITNLRLSRNKKTGASKGYAFVEFEDAGTAAIVAKTMDSYLLFNHILKVKLVPDESQHENLFKGANRRFKKVPHNKIAARELARPRGEADWDAKVEREGRRRSTRAHKLKEIGYEFDAPALKPASAAIGGEGPAAALEAEDKPKAIEAPPAEKEKTGASPKPKTAKAKKGAKGRKSR